MRKFSILLAAMAAFASGGVSAAWYWPFGSSTPEAKKVVSPADEADGLLCDCKLEEARAAYCRIRAELTGMLRDPNEDPVATSNLLALVNGRIEGVDRELKEKPPLKELLKPLLDDVAKADALLDDGETKEAEEAYRAVLTNALPSVVTQNVVRAERPAFQIVINAKTQYVNDRLREIRKDKRLSELMEPASRLLDEAADLMADGEKDKAIEKYREALRELDRIEVENEERASTPEFQSVRNKRAYVDTQLNDILLEEARLNAKAVAVTDTTELEKKLAKKRAAEKAQEKDERERMASGIRPKLESELGTYMDKARARDKVLTEKAKTAKFERENEEKIEELLSKDPSSRKGRLMRAGLELYRKNYGFARRDLDILLAQNENDVSALNMLAALEAATGGYSAAEAALIKAIRADRKDYHAYYNLAKLLYRRNHGRDRVQARKLYRDGRKPVKDGGPGGPVDDYLERVFKK